MPTPARFHLDEQVHPAVAVGLRAQGVDVTTTAEAHLGGADDASHLAFALGTGRVVITHDHDFLRLHAGGTPHAGIAYCHQDKYTLSDLLHVLILLHACYTAEEMAGRVEYL